MVELFLIYYLFFKNKKYFFYFTNTKIFSLVIKTFSNEGLIRNFDRKLPCFKIENFSLKILFILDQNFSPNIDDFFSEINKI